MCALDNIHFGEQLEEYVSRDVIRYVSHHLYPTVFHEGAKGHIQNIIKGHADVGEEKLQRLKRRLELFVDFNGMNETGARDYAPGQIASACTDFYDDVVGANLCQPHEFIEQVLVFQKVLRQTLFQSHTNPGPSAKNPSRSGRKRDLSQHRWPL